MKFSLSSAFVFTNMGGGSGIEQSTSNMVEVPDSDDEKEPTPALQFADAASAEFAEAQFE